MVNKFKDFKFRKTFWQTPQLAVKALLFLLFWAAITLVLATGLFESEMNIEMGEPSPELIRAPFDKDIEDRAGYEQELLRLREETPPVYRINESFVQTFSQRFGSMFTELIIVVQEAPADGAEPGAVGSYLAAVAALRNNDYYSVLTDETFADILALSPETLASAYETADAIISARLQDVERGAKTDGEVPALMTETQQAVLDAALPLPLQGLISSFIGQELNKPTLVIDGQATEWVIEEATGKLEPKIYSYRAGEKIVGPGEIINERVYFVLSSFGMIQTESIVRPFFGIMLLVLLGMVVTVIFAYQFCAPIQEHWQKILLVGIAELALLILSKGLLSIDLGSEEMNSLVMLLAPVAWVTMTVSILLGNRMGVMISVTQALFITVMADPSAFGTHGGMGMIIYLFSGFVGAQSVARLGQRSDLAKAGVFIALTNLFLFTGMMLTQGGVLLDVTAGIVAVVLNALLTVILTVGALPGFEYAFKITSSVHLIELANPNNPLLKSLLMEAPGTYHHSVMVGNLAETAAEEIGANSVLVRVGALYHDIGKLKRPYFFIENQFSRENPHDRIAPSLSALILTAHTKDGLEMAKQHNLPESLQQIILQHHGNSLASFFYSKALEENPDISEDIFRYSGPNPQTKEAALVLLADGVEAAVRASGGANPGKIEGIVRKIIKDKLDNGHLGQCDLTFRDLDKIAVAFVKVLSGIYHTRITYPEMPVRKALKEGVKEAPKEAAPKEVPQEVTPQEVTQEAPPAQEPQETKTQGAAPAD